MNGETIHLIDDDSGLRNALSRLLRLHGYEVRAFANATEFLNNCHSHEIGCLLLDVSLPGLSGLELQRQLVRSRVTAPIVFLTGHADVPTTVRAVKAGAIDFLTKPVETSDLLQAVRNALAYGASVRAERGETLRLAALFRQLTPREREVLEGVVAGKPNKIIADELGIGEQTVKVHRGRMMEKMQTDSLADLIRMVQRLRREEPDCYRPPMAS
ncbi:response regulator [Haloferula sp. BvORR071]|uniref:response regulator transcription factor n=1 Tax=Haloferula sp. BvORR071 TaxID=1396141 RepID=UPI000552A403|nr:response regulator [Haloferula sp. BvORR071]